MPSGISITSHDSFTKDLLYQFDKRRSQLLSNEEHIASSIGNSIHQQSPKLSSLIAATGPTASSAIQKSSTLASSSSHSHSTETTATGENATNHVLIEQEREIIQGNNKNNSNRRRSAGDLLRKSSLYLRNKFNEGFHHNTHLEQQQHIEDQHGASLFNSWTLKKKKKRRNAQDVFQNSAASISLPPSLPPTQQQLSKIAINTTINIQPLNHTNNKSNSKNPIQPPIITQYPPKPLKYSPVEPLPDDDDDANNNDNGNSSTGAALHYKKSKTLHRLSLPLLKLTAQQQQQQQQQQSENTLQRRRSDSDLLNRDLVVEKTSHSMLHSISKKWNKLLSTCIQRGVKKKE
ncbi:hypothetical protein HMPREF1544_05277 [Mucor circinelloides 1006PhL]|uniref:Uncharacterized protein n=1 Tax=Mucor circinelloides f. circinelloides (strain 1006PhL) TaxID=1220926 RepID=S2K6Q0_MUCC1|nr:hypothetical protein HMPREF1544_05277 [Mucor circinelloides 1006PhL]